MTPGIDFARGPSSRLHPPRRRRHRRRKSESSSSESGLQRRDPRPRSSSSRSSRVLVDVEGSSSSSVGVTVSLRSPAWGVSSSQWAVDRRPAQREAAGSPDSSSRDQPARTSPLPSREHGILTGACTGPWRPCSYLDSSDALFDRLPARHRAQTFAQSPRPNRPGRLVQQNPTATAKFGHDGEHQVGSQPRSQPPAPATVTSDT